MHVKPTAPPAQAQGVSASPAITHYENFPVASVLCPPRLRPPIAAIYHFARTADDLADEGTASAEQRLAELDCYLQDFRASLAGQSGSQRWRHVMEPLATMQAQWALPVNLLEALISAFRQDVLHTRDQLTHPDRASLLDYCSRSANPVGRLLLHLHDIDAPTLLAQSDAICSALQLINFWQDLSQDIPRGRHYLCDADCERFGVGRAELAALQATPQALKLIADNIAWAEGLMHEGAPLVHHLPGRAGWELRMVVQGGVRVAERLRRVGCNSLAYRPKLSAVDLIWVTWRSLCMTQDMTLRASP
jgi:squalene synthase HpnC